MLLRFQSIFLHDRITQRWFGAIIENHLRHEWGRKHPEVSKIVLLLESAYSLIWTSHQIWETFWLSYDNLVANQLIYLFMFQYANPKSRNVLFEFFRFVQNQCHVVVSKFWVSVRVCFYKMIILIY